MNSIQITKDQYCFQKKSIICDNSYIFDMIEFKLKMFAISLECTDYCVELKLMEIKSILGSY